MKMTIDRRIKYLETHMWTRDVIKYYKEFSSKPQYIQDQIIKDYDVYLVLSRTSEAGQIYKESRQALKDKNIPELKRLGAIARQRLADKDYEKSEPFDPKYIRNHSMITQYRNLVAKTTPDVPDDFREQLLK